MPGEINIDKDKQLLRVRFTSDSTVNHWKNALVQVELLSEKTGIYRVLIDVRKQKELAGSFELFEFGSNLPRNIAFAVVYETHVEDHEFIETVATNRGINVKGFDTERDAEKWLANWPNRASTNV